MAATRGHRADVLVSLCLFAGVVGYLWQLPRFLGGDEGYYLFEAKRLLAGEVFFRDVFDLITPGAHYLMAGLFAVFGTDMATARGADAVVHGAIVCAGYAICRMLGVRRGLAAGAALLQPAFFQSAWQCASPHWIATLLGLLVLAVLIRDGRRAAFLAGLLSGLVVAVQQQKGFAFVIGVPAILLAEAGVARRAGGTPAPFLPRLARFVGGLLLVVVPFVGLLVCTAGLEPTVYALVLHPLSNYRGINRVPWGYTHVFPSYTFPGVFGYLPVIAALAGVRVLGEVRHAAHPRRLRMSAVLVLFALVSIGSITYNPDYIHLAFVGSVFAVLLADLVEWALGWLDGRPALARALGWAVAALLLVADGAQMGRVMVRSQRDYPFVYASPFGRVNFHAREEVEEYDHLRALVHASGSTELFVYPWGGAPHLLTGATNPTPYQLLLAGYNSTDQLAQVIDILERRQVLNALVLTPMAPANPVLAYVARHYAPVEDGPWKFRLLRRIARATARESGEPVTGGR